MYLILNSLEHHKYSPTLLCCFKLYIKIFTLESEHIDKTLIRVSATIGGKKTFYFQMRHVQLFYTFYLFSTNLKFFFRGIIVLLDFKTFPLPIFLKLFLFTFCCFSVSALSSRIFYNDEVWTKTFPRISSNHSYSMVCRNKNKA